MYQTVIWATDGSEAADVALTEALHLIEPTGRLVAVHCDQRITGGRAGGVSFLADEQDVRAKIKAQVEQVRAEGREADRRPLCRAPLGYRGSRTDQTGNAGHNPRLIVPMTFLLAVLASSGDILQISQGLPSAIVTVLSATLMMIVLLARAGRRAT